MEVEHASHDEQRALVILLAAGVGHGEQHVVGNLGVVRSQSLFAPGDGQLQEVVGVLEFAGRGAHRGETLQDVVAHGIFARQLLRQVPGLQQGLAGAFVIALHVGGLRRLFEFRDGGGRFLVLRQTARRGHQHDANDSQRKASHHISSFSTNSLALSSPSALPCFDTASNHFVPARMGNIEPRGFG